MARAAFVLSCFLNALLAQGIALDATGDIDCSLYPAVCQPPFECQKGLNDSFVQQMSWQIALKDGGANLKSWCLAGGSVYWASTVQQCLANKDLVHGAKVKYETQKAVGNDDEDAKWCFAEKHCTNTEVNSETTVEEAEEICDQRYGQWWRHAGLKTLVPGLQENPGMSPKQIGDYAKEHQLKLGSVRFEQGAMKRSMLSCAMGSYHCDVMYCKETYCKDSNFVAKYSNLLRTSAWQGKHASLIAKKMGRQVLPAAE